jgi:hypothetical protein
MYYCALDQLLAPTSRPGRRLSCANLRRYCPKEGEGRPPSAIFEICVWQHDQFAIAAENCVGRRRAIVAVSTLSTCASCVMVFLPVGHFLVYGAPLRQRSSGFSPAMCSWSFVFLCAKTLCNRRVSSSAISPATLLVSDHMVSSINNGVALVLGRSLLLYHDTWSLLHPVVCSQGGSMRAP